MIRCNRLLSVVALPFLLSIISFGCSGGGGSDPAPPPSPSPSIQATPSTFNFGSVTPGNSPAPLDLEIKNIGNANLNVSGISLVDNNNFKLGSGTGSNPCSTATPIAPGSSCSVEIKFQPTNPERLDSYATALIISSNDPKNSTVNVLLSGSQVAISELNLQINRTEISCVTGVVTAYVSVTDQGGYFVTGLTKENFTVTGPAGYGGQPTTAPFVENAATLSAALVLDFSTSITNFPDRVSDMRGAAESFVNQLGTEDEAEIIKFGGQAIDVVAPFTNNKDTLITAINNPWDNGAGTRLYDAVKVAVDNTAQRQKDRKAVIAISDGWSWGTNFGLDDIIDYASLNNVPIFTVGLGDNVNVLGLTRMADETGGQYYEASTSDNLRTVYQQLADVLLHYQYILTYTSALGAGATDNTTITATLPSNPAIVGSDMKEITRPAICP